VQLVLGAQLRHATEWLSSTAFQMITIFHIAFASLLVAEAGCLFFVIRSGASSNRFGLLPWIFVCIILVQIALGVATWMLKYGWPWGTEHLVSLLPQSWLPEKTEERIYVIPARSLFQTIIVTSHVATGSLILATTGLMSFRSWSLFGMSGTVMQKSANTISSIAQTKSDNNLLRSALACSMGGTR
jgi:cytochrome c oxidase assembly protein subunit 15